MKTYIKSIAVWLLFASALCPCAALGQPTSASSISFQGALTGAGGQPLANGSYNLTFKFYTNATTITSMATSIVTNVQVTGGIVSTIIPVEAEWFDGRTRYLGMAINGGPELSPRVTVTAVPYAAYSQTTRGIRVDPLALFNPPIAMARPSRRVVVGTTTEDISRIPIAEEALVIGTTNGAAGTSVGIYFDTLSRADSAIIVEKNSGDSIEDNSMHFYVGKENALVTKKAMTITQDGNVGIGTPQQVYSRLVVGSSNGDADRMPPCHEAMVIGTKDNAGAGTRAGLYFDTNERNGGGIIVEKVNDGSNEDHRMRFYVTKEGDDKSHNYMTIYENGIVEVPVLRIKGGADLAEHLSVDDGQADDEFNVEPGMTVSIDSSGNRKFKLSDQPYDRKRVGIISGGNGVRPGLVLHDEGNPIADGDYPIALTGQVWCRADASFGQIVPGDLITTSSTPGHAMKVTDETRARFSVLGQALTGLKEGRGWVQVLVGKQ